MRAAERPDEIPDDVDGDEDDELTGTGREIKKLVKKTDKSGAYESDDEENPYASVSQMIMHSLPETSQTDCTCTTSAHSRTRKTTMRPSLQEVEAVTRVDLRVLNLRDPDPDELNLRVRTRGNTLLLELELQSAVVVPPTSRNELLRLLDVLQRVETLLQDLHPSPRRNVNE